MGEMAKAILTIVMAAVTAQLICDNTREKSDCREVWKTMHDIANTCLKSNVDFSRDDHQHEYIGRKNSGKCEKCKLEYFRELFGKDTNKLQNRISSHIHCRTESRRKCKNTMKHIQRSTLNFYSGELRGRCHESCPVTDRCSANQLLLLQSVRFKQYTQHNYCNTQL